MDRGKSNQVLNKIFLKLWHEKELELSVILQNFPSCIYKYEQYVDYYSYEILGALVAGRVTGATVRPSGRQH